MVSERAERIELLDCPFDAITENATVDLVFEWISQGRRNRTNGTLVRNSHHIITVNVSILMMARDDAKLENAISKADLVVVDGKPLVWTSNWLGSPVPQRVSGVDLMRRLLEEGNSRKGGLAIFLLGTTQDRLEVLERVIRERYPNVLISGTRNGYFKPPDYADITTMIRESNTDLLLVGMPAPFKEIWCEEQREALGTPVMLGVGGAFDVMAGFVPRAPRIMQEAGLEWAWRLAMEPKKLFKRYMMTNTAFLILLGKTLLKKSLRRK